MIPWQKLKRLQTDVSALVVLGVVLFLGLCLAGYSAADSPGQAVWPVAESHGNWLGSVGAAVAHTLFLSFGLGVWVLLGVLVAWNVSLFLGREGSAVWLRRVSTALGILGACVLLHLFILSFGETPVGSGGLAGVWSIALLEEAFTHTGIVILACAAIAAALVINSDTPLLQAPLKLVAMPLAAAGGLVAGRGSQTETDEEDWEETATYQPPTSRREIESQADEDHFDPEDDGEDEVVSVVAANSGSTSEEKVELVSRRGNKRIINVNPPTKLNGPGTSQPVNHQLPRLGMLDEPEEFPYELLAKRAQLAAQTLEQAFTDFNLNVKVVEIDTGPVVTQFELELEAGLRLSKITALADDLAIALRVPSVRVVAPIPGKNTVGVEVPNDKRVMVRLRELLQVCSTDTDDMHVPLYVGKDVGGKPLVVDMTKMPHLLIAGRTGTGKSVCLNTLILSILMTRTPDEVRMLMIDPKMVELSPYKRVPHLMHPVITDMKKAEACLAWAVDKMEERYELLARVGVRHSDSFNKMGREKVLQRLGLDPHSPEADEIPEKMPYIVIIADEMADLMMTAGKEVESHIIRLAQKSRAVGIHLVLATQKPTVDVITGLIKSNLPARISFQVASKTDSRVVLDESGADKLLGNGDMLYLAPGTSNVTRAQGTYVSDEEINAVIDFYGDREPEYDAELVNLEAASSAPSPGNIDSSRDELYEQAVEVIVNEGRGSVSLLQRHLGIGYGRAARLIDYMAEDGIVGEYNGSQAREVLYSPDQWASMRA